VAFCRWLGKEMGLTESDQCYVNPESLDQIRYPRDPKVDWAPRDWPLELDRRGFRLPLMSEWEVVARSGARTAYGFGGEMELLDRFGWFTKNSNSRVHQGRALRPSVRGLFDLHGNVYEWSHTWFAEFGESEQSDPLRSITTLSRASRGGGWRSVAEICRSAHRDGDTPEFRHNDFGFRLAYFPLMDAELVEEEDIEIRKSK